MLRRGDSGPVRWLISLAMLAACGCRDRQPPAPTEEQATQLNEMDNALNALGENEEGPADRSAGPSNQTN
jgi:hypothetical protein